MTRSISGLYPPDPRLAANKFYTKLSELEADKGLSNFDRWMKMAKYVKRLGSPDVVSLSCDDEWFVNAGLFVVADRETFDVDPHLRVDLVFMPGMGERKAIVFRGGRDRTKALRDALSAILEKKCRPGGTNLKPLKKKCRPVGTNRKRRSQRLPRTSC